MDDKLKMQKREPDQPAGSANRLGLGHYCLNCGSYRNDPIVYIKVKDGCKTKYRCAVCGAILVER